MPKPLLEGFSLHTSFSRHFGRKRDTVGKVRHGGEDAFQFSTHRVVSAQGALQLTKPVLQNEKVRFGCDGQLGIETLDEKTTLVKKPV